jgi:methyl-accepting chemotaxis protein
MNNAVDVQPDIGSGLPPSLSGEAAWQALVSETELARFVPHLDLMSRQLRQTSQQIESSVVDVCNSFEGIAARARSTVARSSGFLSGDDMGHSSRQSFEGLIDNCAETLVKILKAIEEAGHVSRRAIERIQQMEKTSKMIDAELDKLERIARENKMLAMNARIEAAHAGALGAGFAVVAVEVVSQTEKAQEVTGQVSDLISNLRNLAESTVKDLQHMNEQDHKRVEQCKEEVDRSLRDMQTTHADMKKMLTGMNEESALLASDIGSAVRGLQFQDRTSQQIAHVIEDLDTLHVRLAGCLDGVTGEHSPEMLGLSAYTMQEERQVANICSAESPAGDVELF